MADVTDGTSHTAAWSERLKGDFTNAIATERTDLFWPKTFPATPDAAMADCRSIDGKNLGFQGSSNTGAPWISGSAVTGVIGGLHGGGCAQNLSYSSPFDGHTTELFARAQAGGPGDEPPSSFDDAC